MPAAPSNPPYATLLTFCRYVGRTGPAKATFVGGLRRARQTRSGFNPHAQFVKALKADIARPGSGGQRVIAAVVDIISNSRRRGARKKRPRPSNFALGAQGAFPPAVAAFLLPRPLEARMKISEPSTSRACNLPRMSV